LLERARAEEVRNTPVITVVQPALIPAWPNRRYLPLRLLGGGVMGALIALVVIGVREYGRYQRVHNSREYEQLMKAAAGLSSRVHHRAGRGVTPRT
jgi:hypothetical protein